MDILQIKHPIHTHTHSYQPECLVQFWFEWTVDEDVMPFLFKGKVEEKLANRNKPITLNHTKLGGSVGFPYACGNLISMSFSTQLNHRDTLMGKRKTSQQHTHTQKRGLSVGVVWRARGFVISGSGGERERINRNLFFKRFWRVLTWDDDGGFKHIFYAFVGRFLWIKARFEVCLLFKNLFVLLNYSFYFSIEKLQYIWKCLFGIKCFGLSSATKKSFQAHTRFDRTPNGAQSQSLTHCTTSPPSVSIVKSSF